MPAVNIHVLATLGGVFAILLLATITVSVIKRARSAANLREVEQRVRSWWVMAFVFTLAIVLNEVISLVFFCLVSLLAFREYLSLIPTRRADRRVLFWA